MNSRNIKKGNDVVKSDVGEGIDNNAICLKLWNKKNMFIKPNVMSNINLFDTYHLVDTYHDGLTKVVGEVAKF